QAKDDYARVGEPLEVLDTEARIAECLVFSGSATAALRTAEDVLSRCESAEGLIAAVPLLHRVRAYAYRQLGHRMAVRPALDASLAAAERRGAQHDVAFALHAMTTLGAANDAAEAQQFAARRDELFSALGVVAPPVVPTSDVDVAIPRQRGESRRLRTVQ
ncbi:MAG: hypothetical protein LC750_18730, partial [Actinobacteria bacterium]|nr:hypothetical protein [Actinomycetota bacterium]